MSDKVFLRRALIVLGIVVGALFLWTARHVVLLLFGAVLVAVLLDSMASPLVQRWHVPRTLAVGLGVTLSLAVLVSLWNLFGAQLERQLADLATRVPDAWRRLSEQLGAERPLERFLDQGVRVLTGHSGDLISGAAGLIGALAGIVIDLLLVVFGGMYLAIQPGLYRRGVLEPLGFAERHRVRGFLDEAGHALRGWLLAQLMAMVLVGLVVGSGLWLIGVPSPWALGVLAGAAEFVPLVGPVLAALPAVILAFGEGWSTAGWTVALYVVVQQLEGNVLWPFLGRHVIDLPPALSLFAIVAFGIVLGPLGVLFAIPLTVVTVVALRSFVLDEPPGPGASVGEHRT